MYVKILSIGMEEDHVHLYVSIPLSNPIPYVVQILKGRTSKVLWSQYGKYLRKYFWEKNHLWAVGYFVCTVGEVNSEIIKKYVEQQGREDVE